MEEVRGFPRLSLVSCQALTMRYVKSLVLLTAMGYVVTYSIKFIWDHIQ